MSSEAAANRARPQPTRILHLTHSSSPNSDLGSSYELASDMSTQNRALQVPSEHAGLSGPAAGWQTRHTSPSMVIGGCRHTWGPGLAKGDRSESCTEPSVEDGCPGSKALRGLGGSASWNSGCLCSVSSVCRPSSSQKCVMGSNYPDCWLHGAHASDALSQLCTAWLAAASSMSSSGGYWLVQPEAGAQLSRVHGA